MRTSKKTKIKINSLPEEAKIGTILPGIKKSHCCTNAQRCRMRGNVLEKLRSRHKRQKNYLSKDSHTPSINSGVFYLYKIKKLQHQKIIMTFYSSTTTTMTKITKKILKTIYFLRLQCFFWKHRVFLQNWRTIGKNLSRRLLLPRKKSNGLVICKRDTTKNGPD